MNNMHEILNNQKKFYLENGAPSYELRIDRLNRVKDIVLINKDRIVDALNEDFGVRSKNQSMMTDVYSIIPDIEYTKKNLKKWMKISNRKVSFPFNLLGGKAFVRYEPLGTVGMISPWNFPVNLTFSPLCAIFAAGNQVMHKPSEYTPNSASLLKEICDKAFDENEFATVLGGPDVGSEFTALNFDHLLFTGSGNIGKLVMKGAAENLVPVTLELGGKSPVIIGDNADLNMTAKRVMMGKTMNAGQICLAPDYILVNEDLEKDIVSELETVTSDFFPEMKNNPDYTSIINQKHYERLNELIEDATSKGAKVTQINPNNEDFSQQESFKIPPTIIQNVNDDMNVMKEEIFGPILPIKTYKDIDETIQYINSKDRPLGLYYFGNNTSEEQMVLDSTSSGGVTINDVIGHIQQSDLPFGGVGPSGIGKYKGYEGFLNFSNSRAIHKQIGKRFDSLFNAIRPPFKGDIEKTLKQIAK